MVGNSGLKGTGRLRPFSPLSFLVADSAQTTSSKSHRPVWGRAEREETEPVLGELGHPRGSWGPAVFSRGLRQPSPARDRQRVSSGGFSEGFRALLEQQLLSFCP